MWKGASVLAIAALVACGTPASPPAVSPPPFERSLRLAPGAVLQADMAGGETHVYRFDLPAGGFADIAVEQLGIDVAVRVEDPQGRPLAAADSLFGANGPEPVPVVAGTAGTHRLRVHAPGGGKGRYEIRVAAVRPATGRDRDRVEAERRFGAGEILRQRGDRASLEAAAREETAALDLFRSLGERGRAADVLYALGYAHLSLDTYPAAVGFYEEALASYRDQSRDMEIGRTLNDLALAHRSLGQPRRAIALYEEALSLHRLLGDRWAEATSWNGLGRVYDVTGETEKALSCYEKALALWRGIGDRRRETSTLKNLGELYLKLGDPGKALEPLNAALVLAQAAGQDRETGGLLALIGQAHSRAGQHARGIDLLRRALDLQRRAGDLRGEAVTLNDLGWAWLLARRPREARDCFARSLPLLQRLGDGPAEAVAWAGLGWADNGLGRPRRAAESLARALPLLASFGDRRAEAAALLGLARARRRLGDLPGARSAVEAGIRRIESLRADAAGPDLRTAFFASKQDFYTFRVDLLMAMGDPEGALLASEEARSRTLLDLLAEAGARRSAGAPIQGRPASLREIQGQVVGADILLLEYSLGEERSFLWAVTPGAVAAFELPPREEIEEAVRRAYDLLTARGSTLARGRTAIALDELSRVLLQPAAGLLGNNRRLLIVPDGALHLLPFAALPAPGAGRPLIADHEIVTAPSASSLVLRRRELAHRAPPPGTLAVVADPVFAAGGFRRLPYSQEEAEAILAFAPPTGRLGALGPAANREAVLGSDLGRYRIVHFATHGVLDTERPERSGIALSRGFVRAGEIYRLDLPADLVVLSACRTALGKSFRGEGVIGLTRAFQYAGARNVLVSLWEVEDRATAELMRRFYRAMLVEDQAPAAALRSAQLSLRREPGWGAPYFWAGFVLQGDGEASR